MITRYRSCTPISVYVRLSPPMSVSVRLCQSMSAYVLSCPVLSCPVLSCPVLSCPVLSCPVQSFLDSMRQADIDGRVTPPGPPLNFKIVYQTDSKPVQAEIRLQTGGSKSVTSGSKISTTLEPKLKHCPWALYEHARSTKLPRDTSGINTNRFQSVLAQFRGF